MNLPADLKAVLKKIRGDQPLALALCGTGDADAMALAGLAAERPHACA